MLLTRRDDVDISGDTLKYTGEVADRFRKESSVSTGYTDISSIENWCDYGIYAVDFIVCLAEIKVLYNATSWASLTDLEKAVIAKLFLSSYAERISIYTDDQIFELAALYHQKLQAARLRRYNMALLEVFTRVDTKDDRDEIAEAVMDGNLELKYVEAGITGIIDGDAVVGINDYLESQAATPYSSSGLSSQVYTVNGITIGALATKTASIIRTGSFT